MPASKAPRIKSTVGLVTLLRQDIEDAFEVKKKGVAAVLVNLTATYAKFGKLLLKLTSCNS